jgi:hypothetical protein
VPVADRRSRLFVSDFTTGISVPPEGNRTVPIPVNRYTPGRTMLPGEQCATCSVQRGRSCSATGA